MDNAVLKKTAKRVIRDQCREYGRVTVYAIEKLAIAGVWWETRKLPDPPGRLEIVEAVQKIIQAHP